MHDIKAYLACKICSHWEIEGGIFFSFESVVFLGWTKPHLMGIQPATSACLRACLSLEPLFSFFWQNFAKNRN
jgi:hypothetical protein